MEKFGLEEFEEKKYWKSELYIDNGKKIHNALALTKVGWVGTLMMLVTNKSVKEAAAKTKDTPGNLQGDGRYIHHGGLVLGYLTEECMFDGCDLRMKCSKDAWTLFPHLVNCF